MYYKVCFMEKWCNYKIEYEVGTCNYIVPQIIFSLTSPFDMAAAALLHVGGQKTSAGGDFHSIEPR